ncbi:MAG: TAXI family TRAP transporter solute-binding subunit, partial [Spirochaetia bacterium]|nr:TAXI family TRAP transporter solute-binding subunit [Spirochaetia bacterium]
DSFIQIAIEPDKNFREFLKIYPYFYLSIFGSEIGLPDTTQLMTSSFAACAEDMPEEVAYTLTRLWWENMTFVKQYVPGLLELINTKDNRDGVPIPFHKGSIRYLREAGLIPKGGE